MTSQSPETGPPEDSENRAAEELALARVPSGAAALAAIAVGLLLLAWLVVYFAVYLPRGLVS